MTKIKPHHGRILGGTRVGVDLAHSTGLGYRIAGQFLDHPEFRANSITSEVIAHDEQTGEIETRNSKYTLVKQGVAARFMGMPMIGDKVRFLNEHGRDHERAEALRDLGTIRLYTVQAIHIGDWRSSIVLLETGNDREYNTVMFEIVQRADGSTPPARPDDGYVLGADLIRALTDERRYQIDRWGADHDKTKSVGDFVMYIEAYLNDLKLSMTANAPVNPDGMAIMRKIVALGVACMERHGIVQRKD